MCTLIVCRNVFRFYPLVVAANRDERLHRPSSGPSFRDGQRKILNPVDDVFGGTWIGVNDAGVVAAVTNRPAVPHVSGRISRGTLVGIALSRGSAAQGLSAVMDLSGTIYNGFHLAIVDGRDGYLVVGHGDRFAAEPIADGVTIVTGEGYGPEHSERARRIEALMRTHVRRCPPRPAAFAPVLELHDRSGDEAGESGSCLHGAPDDEWVTKSSAVIRLQDRRRPDGSVRRYWEYFHRERPEGLPNCAGRWTAHELDLV